MLGEQHALEDLGDRQARCKPEGGGRVRRFDFRFARAWRFIYIDRTQTYTYPVDNITCASMFPIQTKPGSRCIAIWISKLYSLPLNTNTTGLYCIYGIFYNFRRETGWSGFL